MYQPPHLDSFLRLLVSHLGTVISDGERLMEGSLSEQRDNEALFVLQMSQAREWVDRLGQLDPDVERDADEFLAATFSVEKLLHNRSTRHKDYRLENSLIQPGNDNVLRHKGCGQINVEAMLGSIFELLGRLEDRYDLMEELLDVKQVVNGVPFGRKYSANKSAKIIPLFANMRKTIHQDNDRGNH